MSRNPYFDLLPIGTEVFVANEPSRVFEGWLKMSADERLYFQEQAGTIVEFVEASRPRYRGYKIQMEDGSIIQRSVGKVRLPNETYGDDGSNRELSEILAGLPTASTRPELPRSAQPGVAEFVERRPV